MKNPLGHVDAAIENLAGADGPLEVLEIAPGLGGALEGQVPASSVQSCLRHNRYRLVRQDDRGDYHLEEPPGTTFLQRPAACCDRSSKIELVRDDCFAWLRSRQENSVEAVITDPPYGLVEYSQGEQDKLRRGRGGVWRIPPSFDGHKRAPLPRFTVLDKGDQENLYEFFREWGILLCPVLVPGANVVVASNPLLSHIVANALADAGLERRGEIIRLVMTMRGGDRPKNAHMEFAQVSVMPRSMWEPWLAFRKPIEGRVQDNLRKWKTGGFRRPSPLRPFGDVIKSNPTRNIERRIAPHPSLKPQAFLRTLVRGVLPLGEGTVLDPFMGAGSIMAATRAVGYNGIGIEKDPLYFEIAESAIDRLAALSVNDEPHPAL
jgi:DNA modification methylase